jgi:hypothetical protein
VCQCTPSPETCDGKDNDCNGKIDDEPAVDRGCQATKGASGWVCQGGTCTCGGAMCGDAGCVDLTSDPNHCAACDSACGLSTTCVSSTCRCTGGTSCPVVSGATDTTCGDGTCRSAIRLAPRSTRSMHVTAADVIYTYPVGTAGQYRAIAKVPKAGGPETVIMPQTTTYDVVTDGTYAFFLNGFNGDIYHCSIADCAGSASLVYSHPLAASPGQFGTRMAFAAAGSYLTCPLSGCGGSPKNVGSLDAGGIGVPVFFGIDDDLFILRQGEVLRALGNAPPVTPYYSGVTTARIHVGATKVYWQKGNTIYSCPKGAACTSPTQVFTSSDYYLMGIDETRLYLSDVNATLAYCSISACASPRPIAKVAMSANDFDSFDTDATHFYWSNDTGIYRMPK